MDFPKGISAVVHRDSEVHSCASSPCFMDYYKICSSLRDYVIRSYLKMPEEFVNIILQNRFWVVHIPFVSWSNFKFFHDSHWIILPTELCLVLYSFCASLLHSLIMLLIISSPSSRNLYPLFCWVLSILILIWLVLMALFYGAIWKDSVSLLMFPFRCHVRDFLCNMSLVSPLKRQ